MSLYDSGPLSKEMWEGIARARGREVLDALGQYIGNARVAGEFDDEYRRRLLSRGQVHDKNGHVWQDAGNGADDYCARCGDIYPLFTVVGPCAGERK